MQTARSGPDSQSDAHGATIVGDWEEPSGESRLILVGVITESHTCRVEGIVVKPDIERKYLIDRLSGELQTI